MAMHPSNLSSNFSFDLSYFIELWKAATLCLMVMQPLNFSALTILFCKTLEGCYSVSNGHAAFKLGSPLVTSFSELRTATLVSDQERTNGCVTKLQPSFLILSPISPMSMLTIFCESRRYVFLCRPFEA